MNFRWIYFRNSFPNIPKNLWLFQLTRHFAFFVVCKKGLRHARVSLREPCEIQGEEEVWHALCNNEK
jgi:hypothetical protein